MSLNRKALQIIIHPEIVLLISIQTLQNFDFLSYEISIMNSVYATMS